jgi:hypothetical protein
MVLKRRVVPLLASLGLITMFVACAVPFPTTSTAPGVVITPVPTITVQHRVPVVVQYCADDTTTYPRSDFVEANQLTAKSLVDAVVPYSDGLTLYATLITSHTFDSSNTLAPFIIPAVPNYPALPTPIPTPNQANPVSYSATTTAVANENSANIAAYNAAMSRAAAQIQTIRNQVAADAQRLTSWRPAEDATASSVWGCLQLARTRFQTQSGTKYLIIASNMRNNTNVDYTSYFESSKALAGVRVIVVFYPCEFAGPCELLYEKWRDVFVNSGSPVVRFFDPTQSLALSDLFGTFTGPR